MSYGGLISPLLQTLYDLYMEEEVAVRLLDISSLSPMDFDLLESLLKDSKKVLTVEEGHIPFGIGAAFNFYTGDLHNNKKEIGGLRFIWLERIFKEPKKQIKRTWEYLTVMPMLYFEEKKKRKYGL